MKIIPNFTPRLTWAKVYTRFQTKTTQKPYPLGRHIPIWLIQGSRPPPPPPRAAFIIVFERRHISYSCLPFTLANWSVHGFGKLYSNSGLENFVPESRLPFLQISSIYPKTTAVSKMALKKWNTNFRLEHSVGKNRTTFSNVPLLSEIFLWNDPKSRVPFTFKPDFPETCCKTT